MGRESAAYFGCGLATLDGDAFSQSPVRCEVNMLTTATMMKFMAEDRLIG